MKKFLQWLGGADPEVLDRAPSASNAAAGLGGTVLATAVMAGAAFTMAAHDWLHLPTAVAIIVGVGWGLAIMNLDRWLLIATRRQTAIWHTAALAVPRILLAIVIGFVIAEPLVLRVFQNEVTLQAKDDRQIDKESREKDLARAFGDIPKLEAQQATLQHTIAAGPAVVFAGNPDYAAAYAAYNRAEDELATAQRAVGCEAEGTCGTLKAGCGPVCSADQKVVAQRQTEAAAAEANLNAVTARLRRTSHETATQDRKFATPELVRVDKQLTTRRNEYNSQFATIESDFKTPIGLIDREMALEHLAHEKPVVSSTTWLLRLFLIAVDITPILFKTLLLVGVPSPYERAQGEIESRDHDRLKATEDAEDEAHGIHVQLIIDEAKIQADHRRDALKEMHEEIAKVEKEVWRQQIEDWRNAVRANNGSGAGAPTGNGHGPNGGGHGNVPLSAAPNGSGPAGTPSGAAPQPSGNHQGGPANGAGPSRNGVTPATAHNGGSSWFTQIVSRVRALAGSLRRPEPHAPVGQ